MKKIALITPSLAKGGIERVVVTEAEYLKNYYDVTLIVIDDFRVDYPYSGKSLFLKIPLENRAIYARALSIFRAILKLYIIKCKNRFDLVISHGELTTLPNLLGNCTQSITVMHENRFVIDKDRQGRWVNALMKYLYRFKSLKGIVTVSKGIVPYLLKATNLPPQKIKTIYNPYDIEYIKRASKEPLGEYEKIFDTTTLISVGRLTRQKGQWNLIRVFSQLKSKKSDIRLIILGIGELHDRLYELSKSLGLKCWSYQKDKILKSGYDIYFLGFLSNPFPLIAKADLFLLTSLFEGFGGVIVEAMASGTPVVTADSPSGPKEIVGDNGLVLPMLSIDWLDNKQEQSRVEKLWCESIYRLLNDKNRLSRYIELGYKRANDFDTDTIMKEWHSYIKSLING